uniref:Rootletin-like coiled-coil domain-containing protein n=1 Tax=Heliothis virescens TaxID=7102 RepID=A0A2A4K970_HELVI
MADTSQCPHSARSRAPINEAGATWWELFGDLDRTSQYYVQNEVDDSHNTSKHTEDNKSFNSNNLKVQRALTSKLYGNFIGRTVKNVDPKGKVLKKWREDQAKARYEQARKAVINSLKEKFGVPLHQTNVPSVLNDNKGDNTRAIPTIIITGDNVEETSNSNVNRDGENLEEIVSYCVRARSRAPINEAGATWWELFGDLDRTSQYYVQNEVDDSHNTSKHTEDNKSFNSNNLKVQRALTSKLYGNFIGRTVKNVDPKGKVLKKWREDQAKARYEQARKAVINSLKEKFGVPLHQTNVPSVLNDNKGDNTRAIPTIIITGDNVEETSNSNVNRDGENLEEIVSYCVRGKVEIANAGVEVVSHARRLQMGPGGELAQWRLAPRGSRAAGAEGGLRGLTRIDMPLPSREGLTTPRSARAPIGRRPPSTLPHQRLKKEKSLDSPPEMDSPGGSVSSDLRRQNEELRARLAGEAADHKRRLDAYRRAQQGQAALVSRLQSKVLQYKQRCSELETQMLETTPRSEPSASSTFRAPPPVKTSMALPPPPSASTCASAAVSAADARINDLETALRRLDEEKRKCEKLVQQNNLLRDQLEESHQLNEALTSDLQKLTNDWEALRDEMAIKEDEWKDEEQAFNDYYSNEHHRLLSLWREVVAVKRHFAELQTNTERDLYRVKNDFDSNARELVGMLSGYSINVFAAQNIKPEYQPLSHQGAYQTPQGGYQASQPGYQASQPGYQAQVPHATHPSGHQGSQGHQTTGAGPYSVESMRVDLRDMTAQRDSALAELRERDTRIQRLLGELQELEERCGCAEAACGSASVMRAALEEVARALIHDSDSDAPPAHPAHLHLHDSVIARGAGEVARALIHDSTATRARASAHLTCTTGTHTCNIESVRLRGGGVWLGQRERAALEEWAARSYTTRQRRAPAHPRTCTCTTGTHTCNIGGGVWLGQRDARGAGGWRARSYTTPTATPAAHPAHLHLHDRRRVLGQRDARGAGGSVRARSYTTHSDAPPAIPRTCTCTTGTHTCNIGGGVWLGSVMRAALEEVGALALSIHAACRQRNAGLPSAPTGASLAPAAASGLQCSYSLPPTRWVSNPQV